MFRITLGLEAVDVDKVGKALREASEKAVKEMSREELEELKKEETAWKKFSNLKKSSERKA